MTNRIVEFTVFIEPTYRCDIKQDLVDCLYHLSLTLLHMEYENVLLNTCVFVLQKLWLILTCSHVVLFALSLSFWLLTRYQWKSSTFPPVLSITPAKGYICPGMEVPLEVTYAPIELSDITRYENLSCTVEGYPSPVTFTATGSCTSACNNKEVRFVVSSEKNKSISHSSICLLCSL